MMSAENQPLEPRKPTVQKIWSVPLVRAIAYGLIPFGFLMIKFLLAWLLQNSSLDAQAWSGALCTLASVITGGVLLKNDREAALCQPNVVERNREEQSTFASFKVNLFFLPLFLIIGLNFFWGWGTGAFFQTESLPFFTTIWGITGVLRIVEKEVYFRGLVFETLQEKGIQYAALVAAALFAFMNSPLVFGEMFLQTALLFLFNFSFGFVWVLICFSQGGVWIGILMHILFNKSESFAASAVAGNDMWVKGLQCAVLLLYGAYMLIKIKKIEKA